MANVVVKVNGVTMPGGLTEMKRSDELLWSDGTGRSASSGSMTGSVVAEKQTWSLAWGPLTASDYAKVRNIPGGFVPLKITLSSSTVADCTVYRGAVSGELMGVYGGTAWYGGVAVELVEQ